MRFFDPCEEGLRGVGVQVGGQETEDRVWVRMHQKTEFEQRTGQRGMSTYNVHVHMRTHANHRISHTYNVA